MNKKRPTGTREWSTSNVNIALGCEHNCRYCYARHRALRFGRIKSADEWQKMTILYHKVAKSYRKRQGTIMFPSAHDITPKTLVDSIFALNRMLMYDNKVLIASKPHLGCIKAICNGLEPYKEQVLFRFTIGSFNDRVLRFWEPNAPTFNERIYALQYAFKHGFQTSISCEPLLDTKTIELFYSVKPFVTHSVWLGGLNRHRERVDQTGWGTEERAFLIEALAAKAPDSVRAYYQLLKSERLVRWKDSFKKILGIESPAEIGMDI